MAHSVTDRLRRSLGAGILGVSTVLLATGSSLSYGADEQSASNLSVIDNGYGKHAVVSSKISGGGTETLSKKLIIANGACFYATARDAAPTLLIFPETITISHEGRPAIELDGKRYFVGARLKFTGDTVSLSDDQHGQIAPCAPHGDVFQVTSLSR